MFQSGISIVSLIISVVIFIVATGVQLYYFIGNRKKLEVVRDFFTKRRDYEVYGEAEDSQLNPYVAEVGSSLHSLIMNLTSTPKRTMAPRIFRSSKIRLTEKSMSFTIMQLQELHSRLMWASWVLLPVYSLVCCFLLLGLVRLRMVRESQTRQSAI